MATIKSRDNYWSRQVKNRSRHRCQIGLSGCLREATDAAHIMPRRFMKLRHDTDNGLAACRFCHGECDTHKVDFVALVKRIEPEQFERLRYKYLEFYNKDIEKWQK